MRGCQYGGLVAWNAERDSSHSVIEFSRAILILKAQLTRFLLAMMNKVLDGCGEGYLSPKRMSLRAS